MVKEKWVVFPLALPIDLSRKEMEDDSNITGPGVEFGDDQIIFKNISTISGSNNMPAFTRKYSRTFSFGQDFL